MCNRAVNKYYINDLYTIYTSKATKQIKYFYSKPCCVEDLISSLFSKILFTIIITLCVHCPLVFVQIYSTIQPLFWCDNPVIDIEAYIQTQKSVYIVSSRETMHIDDLSIKLVNMGDLEMTSILMY